MKYSLQCKYSMINQTFLFILKSMEQGNDYQFEWQIKQVDKPVWILTNNNILFKAQNVDDLVEFSVVSSNVDIKEKLIKTSTVPILTFQTDKEDLQIIYDFKRQPNKNDKIVASIISKVITAFGGGFLSTEQEYDELQVNIKNVLIDNNLIKQNDNNIDNNNDDNNVLQQTVEVKPKKARKHKKSTEQNKGE